MKKKQNCKQKQQKFDPQGSYTGKSNGKYDEVVQDADDL